MSRFVFPEKSDSDIEEFIGKELQNSFKSLKEEFKTFKEPDDALLDDKTKKLKPEIAKVFELQSQSLNNKFQILLTTLKHIPDMQYKELLKFEILKKRATNWNNKLKDQICLIIYASEGRLRKETFLEIYEDL